MKLVLAAAILMATVTLLVTADEQQQQQLRHYHNYTVYRLRPQTEFQLNALHLLGDELDFWREPDAVNRFADVMLAPAQKAQYLKLFGENGISHELLIPDVEKQIETERQAQRSAPALNIRESRETEAIAGFWNTYQRWSQHLALVDALVAQNPAIVARISLGNSYLGNPLIVARIGANSAASAKPVIWLEGGIHAREWISPATVTYFAQQLVNRFNAGDPVAVDLLNYFDFYIVPVLNVDGYEYSHTNERLWRKTRKPSVNSATCIGTDPNRNFGYQWGGTGASNNPCAETYRGDAAFSEPEVKAETDYILNQLPGRVKSFLAVHSYGQYFLYPWGYALEYTPDDAELNRVGKASVVALNAVSPSTVYTVGTSTAVLYAAAGGADDWSYGSAGATYSYTVELRDTGTYGFQLPASQIVPTGQETTAAFIALAQEVKAKLTN